MIAGVAIDTWKLATFKAALDEAGFAYTEHELTAASMMLKVETKSAAALKPVVERAQRRCRQ